LLAVLNAGDIDLAGRVHRKPWTAPGWIFIVSPQGKRKKPPRILHR
jgi:hypothetical protein